MLQSVSQTPLAATPLLFSRTKLIFWGPSSSRFSSNLLFFPPWEKNLQWIGSKCSVSLSVRSDLGRWHHSEGSVQGAVQAEEDPLHAAAEWTCLQHGRQVGYQVTLHHLCAAVRPKTDSKALWGVVPEKLTDWLFFLYGKRTVTWSAPRGRSQGGGGVASATDDVS